MFEFAKRFFWKGEEVTPFPTGAFLSSRGSIPGLAVALDNSFEKSCLPRLVTATRARSDLFSKTISLLSSSMGEVSREKKLYKRFFSSGGVPAERLLEITLGLTAFARSVEDPKSADEASFAR